MSIEQKQIMNCRGQEVCNSDLQGNILRVKLLRMSLMSMALPISIIVLFWKKYGMNMFEVMLLQAIFAVGITILEVPSGYVADLFGRKRVLLVGQVMYFLGVAVYSLTSGFYGFLVAELIFAVGVSMISGADEALLYDSLVLLKREGEHDQIWGKVGFYEKWFSAFCCLVGGALALISYRLPFYVAVIIASVGVVAAIGLVEPKSSKHSASHESALQILVMARDSFLGSSRLVWIVCYSAVLMSVLNICFWLYQPYLKMSGISEGYFGLIYFAFNVVAAQSSKNAYRLTRRLGHLAVLAMICLASVISLLLLGSVVATAGFMFIFLQQIARGVGSVAVSECVNQLTSSEVRATVLSVNNLSTRLFYSLLLLPMGSLVEGWGILAGMNALAGVLLVLGLLLFWRRPGYYVLSES